MGIIITKIISLLEISLRIQLSETYEAPRTGPGTVSTPTLAAPNAPAAAAITPSAPFQPPG